MDDLARAATADPPARPPAAPTGGAPGAGAPRLRWTGRGAEATRAFGAALGRCLPPGSLLTLDGPLGAGKTTLAQGIAAGLGVAGPVTSPTFTLLRRYAAPPTAQGASDPPSRLVHADLYRVGSAAEARELGLDEHRADGDRVVVEWPSRAAGGLDDVDAAVRLTPPGAAGGDDERTIDVAAVSDVGRAIVACLRAALAAAGSDGGA